MRATRTRRGASATGAGALVKGFWLAHIGWLFDASTPTARSSRPDLLADADIRRVDKLFPVLGRRPLLAAGRCSAA